MRFHVFISALALVALTLLVSSVSADPMIISQSMLQIGMRDTLDVETVTAGTTSRVSISSDGSEGNDRSYGPSISADGRYVAFASLASNLVNGDTNEEIDIFFHDTQTGETVRVSVASGGTQANGSSWPPSISGDGRYVVFWSDASNLVNNDTYGLADVFVHDTQSGTTSRVSVASNGAQGNGSSEDPSISGDGRYVAFTSAANNLVAGDTNECLGFSGGHCPDVFVHDTQTGTTSRVSIASNGTEGNDPSQTPSISANGRYIAFGSDASNLVDNDTNSYQDVFVHDTQTSTTSRVSVASDGTEGNSWSGGSAISADGRYVAFSSDASNLVDNDTNSYQDVFVHDTQTGTTSRVSITSDGIEGNESSHWPSVSNDGRYVAFYSYASNLVDGDTNAEADIFVHDMETGDTSRASVASDGAEANNWSWAPSLSASGRYVAFFSNASNLVNDDSNEEIDVFVRDRADLSPCEIPYFSQRDAAWIDHPLRGNCSGCNPQTIGVCGCTLTSAAMLFAYYGATVTPSALSDCMSNQACPFYWYVGASCSQGKANFQYRTDFSWSTDWPLLERELNQNGRPVLLGMFNTRTGQPHWVLVTSGQGSDPADYKMHDPWPLNGANHTLDILIRDNYQFNAMAVYAGQPACNSFSLTAHDGPPVQAVPILDEAGENDRGEKVPDHPASEDVMGELWLYERTLLTMTVQITATSTLSPITEMQVWTEGDPNPEWQAFAPYAWLPWYPEHETIYARFKDELGNISDVVTDTTHPTNGPPPQPFWQLYLPAVSSDTP